MPWQEFPCHLSISCLLCSFHFPLFPKYYFWNLFDKNFMLGYIQDVKTGANPWVW